MHPVKLLEEISIIALKIIETTLGENIYTPLFFRKEFRKIKALKYASN